MNGAEQISEEIKAKNFADSVRDKFIASRSSAKPKPKQNKYKENHTTVKGELKRLHRIL